MTSNNSNSTSETVATPVPEPEVKAAPRDKIAEKAEDVQAKAASKAEELKGKASEKAEELKGKASEKAEELKGKADEFRTKAAEKARSAADEGKAKTGAAFVRMSEVIEENAKIIDDNVGSKYGDYARSAADSINKFGHRVEEKEIDEMVEDTREFIRARPVAAVGAAAALGFMLARLLKSGRKDS